MWYSADSDRPLQISFILDNGLRAQYHETQIVDHFNEIERIYRSVPRYGLRDFDGAVSVVHQGRELLGGHYWMDFLTEAPLNVIVCEGKEARHRLEDNKAKFVIMSALEGDLLFQVVVLGETITKKRLPFELFIREWTLMRVRLLRVRIELGDDSVDPLEPLDSLARRPVGICEAVATIVGFDHLRYTATVPIDVILRDPVPRRPKLTEYLG